MSIFKELCDTVNSSFDYKKYKFLEQKLKQENKALEVNQNILCDTEKLESEIILKNKELISTLKQENNLYQALIKTNDVVTSILQKKDVNYRNAYAKIKNINSGFKYFLKLKKDKNDAQTNIENNKLRIYEINNEIESNNEKLREIEIKKNNLKIKIDNNNKNIKSICDILYYNKCNKYFYITAIIVALILSANYLMQFLLPNDIAKIIIQASLSFVILVLNIIEYLINYKLAKRIALHKPNLWIYFFSFAISFSIFLLIFANNNIANYMILISNAYLYVFSIYNLFYIKKLSETDEKFYFPIDFLILNLSIINTTIISIICNIELNRNIQLINSIMYSIVIFTYIVIAFWIYGNSYKKIKKDFISYILIIVLLISLLGFIIICINSFAKLFNINSIVLTIIGILISIATPLFQNFFKKDNQNDKT